MSSKEAIQRQVKGVWIEIEIWESKELSLQEKCLLAEIWSLETPDRGCWASNKHFGEFIGLSSNRVSEIISSLAAKGMIRTEMIMDGKMVKERRIFRVNCKCNNAGGAGGRNPEGQGNLGGDGYSENRGGCSESRGGYSEKAEESNSLSNTKEIKEKDLNDSLSISSKFDIEVKQALDLLNELTGSKFRSSTSSHSQNISARLSQGHTIEDLMLVIKHKCSEWGRDPKMAQYLRPSTLFQAGKFDGYLSAAKVSQSPYANMAEVTRKNLEALNPNTNKATGW